MRVVFLSVVQFYDEGDVHPHGYSGLLSLRSRHDIHADTPFGPRYGVDLDMLNEEGEDLRVVLQEYVGLFVQVRETREQFGQVGLHARRRSLYTIHHNKHKVLVASPIERLGLRMEAEETSLQLVSLLVVARDHRRHDSKVSSRRLCSAKVALPQHRNEILTLLNRDLPFLDVIAGIVSAAV